MDHGKVLTDSCVRGPRYKRCNRRSEAMKLACDPTRSEKVPQIMTELGSLPLASKASLRKLGGYRFSAHHCSGPTTFRGKCGRN